MRIHPKKLVLIGALVVLLGACDIDVRQFEAGTVAKLTYVSTDATLCPAPPRASDHQVIVSIEGGEAKRTKKFGPNGEWGPLTLRAPRTPGAYAVTISCNGVAMTPEFIPYSVVVDPTFAPKASTPGYTPTTVPTQLSVSGRWCISSFALDDLGPPGLLNPTLQASLNGVTLDATAPIDQPFDDTWQLTFPGADLPTAPGIYPIDVTCNYPSIDTEFGQKTAQIPITVAGVFDVTPTAPQKSDTITVANEPGSECTTGPVNLTVGRSSWTVTPDDQGAWTADVGAAQDVKGLTVRADCTDGSAVVFPYVPVTVPRLANGRH